MCAYGLKNLQRVSTSEHVEGTSSILGEAEIIHELFALFYGPIRMVQ